MLPPPEPAGLKHRCQHGQDNIGGSSYRRRLETGDLQTWRDVVESLGDGVTIADRRGMITYANPAFCRIVGYEQAELVGACPPFSHWPIELQAEIEEALARRQSGEQGEFETLFEHKTGRRIAVTVKKVLQAAIANAENNHQLDVDRLYVAEAHVGKAFAMRRFHARGRGRSAGIVKPFSHLTVIVREREAAKTAEKSA